jgi:hypothetical protein
MVHDMSDEMAQELSQLPRFTAYAKIIDDKTVSTHKMQTLPLPNVNQEPVAQAITNGHNASKDREAIEAEIKERQDRWRPGSGGFSPSRRRE